ncbi:MAG: LysR family transcriptional regulator [Candidatus Promineifilaceae bacterium]
MEFHQLEAFVALAREGSFTAAAERLNLSQPSLSARIGRLEASLGGRLVERGKRPLALTDLGRAMLPYAERALSILAEAAAAAQSEALQTAGELKVGCPFSVAAYLMPEVLVRFGRAYPRAELLIETATSDVVVGQLADGLINLAFAAAFPKFLAQMHLLRRFHDEMAVAVAPGHPLAAEKSATLGQALAHRQLLVHWGPAFHAYVESLRQMIPGPGPLLRLPLAAALPMARQPDIVTFLPRRLLTVAGLVAVAVPGFYFAWDTALLTRPQRALTRLEQAFVDISLEVWRASQPPAP